MSAETDLIKLYSRRILALAADMPHARRLAAPMASVKKRAPLCGSTVTVDLDVDAGRITRFGQDVKACALGQASAALMGQNILGRTLAEIEAARDTLKAMLKDNGPPPAAPFKGYEVLKPAREYRNRHASIMLALEATAQAMTEAQQADCA
ncbi:iron-sulfur cluster assembly scaffold protein [Rhodophyticola sp. CCM32]|uniref:iron-sulfur cluster assembly scaffold protein n=1 Tax=Rhodophyticola sp. CCM32 TaxID=2916397 RepID=UPI00107F91C2|nr:iron-sulfur cluster assembly scaffold protein [Rhodophyticola sp. CCM32]QBY00448.1 iron-sulfur cluster assembly scaffold protein [Rhodophyticola sp. CCM32]